MLFKNLDIAKTGSIRIELPRVISRIALKSKKKKKHHRIHKQSKRKNVSIINKRTQQAWSPVHEAKN